MQRTDRLDVIGGAIYRTIINTEFGLDGPLNCSVTMVFVPDVSVTIGKER